MKNDTQQKKVMIIVWKWQNLTHVNENIWTKSDFDYYNKDITKGKGIFFEEYPVESSDLCPDALLVAVSVYKANDDTRKLLYALIKHYASDEHKTMLFLHRGNNYDEYEVEQLLNHFGTRISKCFLFANARDYIYYQTQKAGFLNDTGWFVIGRDKGTKDVVKTFADGKVKQPYFDRVSRYYDIEFETKVFDFKEELLDQWFSFLLPGQPDKIEKSALLAAIEQAKDRALLFRLKSFLGKYQHIRSETDFVKKATLEDEQKTIADLEKKDRTSYEFDDCIVNLEHERHNKLTFVSDAYDDAKKQLDDLVFSAKKTVIRRSEILEVTEKLNYLVKVIPGILPPGQ